MDKDRKKKAQAGDIKAIEEILNRFLGFKNISATVERYHADLYVYLNFSHAHLRKEKYQKNCITLVKTTIRQLELDYIDTIIIHGEKQNNNLFSWKKEVSFKSKHETKTSKYAEEDIDLPTSDDTKTYRKQIYKGGCHCGKVRFHVIINEFKAIKCNCSICRKKGFLHLIVESDKFKLIEGEESIKVYTFNTHIAQHKFCIHCGIHPFYIPRSHPDMIDVNLNCLDDDLIDQFEFQEFDGQNWEDNIEQIKE